MPGLGFGGCNEDATIGMDEFVHGGGVGGDDSGSAAHGLNDVVSPALGERGAEMDGVLVDEFDDFFLTQIVGDEVDVIGDFLRRVVLVLK
jgi:hypothetical protein